jgi:predicted regulator of Ras-like GTPase activity (Roadblock/LC7/MglB family)
MQNVLSQLNSVPGVVGSMLCDWEGQLLAHAFPPLFEPSMLSAAAGVLADCRVGLQSVAGTVTLLDMRYADARIVVRPLSRAHLVFLGAATLNLHLLSISASVAVPKLEKLLQAQAEPPAALGVPLAAAAPSPAGQLHQAVERIDSVIRRRKLDRFKIRGEIALRAGFGLGFIDADTPDDPVMLSKLESAASAVLGEPLS